MLRDEGEHNVENFVLCSFAHHAGSPRSPGFSHEEEPVKRGSGISLLLGCDLPLSGLSGSLSLELFLIGGRLLSTVAASWNDSHIKDGLRQYGEGCDGRRVQVSQWNTEACFSPLMFSLLSVFFMRGGGLLSRRLRSRCCTQSTDVLAPVMRFLCAAAA